MFAAYVVPAVAAWGVLGLCLAAAPLAGFALVTAVAYGSYYGVSELAGRPGLAVPGRRWQVPQSMVINATPRRRLLVWGAVLGPGFLTQNPYAGFGLLPLAVAAMRVVGSGACVALAVAIGLAHGAARATALIRDLRQPAPASPAWQLDVLLKIVYWRRLDGAALLAAAAVAAAASLGYFS